MEELLGSLINLGLLIWRLHNNQVSDLSLTCSNINIDEILYNSNSRITTNISSNVTLKSDVNSSSGMLKVGNSSEYVGNITTERYFSIDGPTNGGWVNIASPIEEYNNGFTSLKLQIYIMWRFHWV